MPPSPSKVALLAAELAAKLKATRLPAFAEAATRSPMGEVLTRFLKPEERQALENAQVIMRRKSLSDLKAGQLQSVHESKRTGAASGAKRSIEARSQMEPKIFGEKGQIYGYLSSDPFASTKQGFSAYYPDRGGSYLAPVGSLKQYGQYGLELHPENRARTTITFDDSLDRTEGPYAMASDIISGRQDFHNVGVEGSRLWQMAKDHMERRNALTQMLKEQGHSDYDIQRKVSEMLAEQGDDADFKQLLKRYELPIFGGEGQYTGQMPRQIPRVLTELDQPILPSESYSLEHIGNLQDTLSQKDHMAYVEAQVHGPVTPEDIRRVYDYNYEPSLSTEKDLKKLGIEYVPRPRDTLYDKAMANPPQNMGEFYDLQQREGSLPDYLRNLSSEYGPPRDPGNQRIKPMLPFKEGFAGGGLVAGAAKALTKTKPAIDPAIKALKKLNPQELDLAISRLESLPQHLDISRYSPAALARISALQPAAQRGFSESMISTRPPFAASLMKPSEFLSRTAPLDAARDPEVIARLKASIGEKKLQELPALWVNQKPGGLDAAYEGRHRMQALLEMYGDDPVMMSLIKGDRFEPRVDFFGKPYEGAVDEMRLSPEEILKQKIQMGDRPLELSPLWTGYAKGGEVKAHGVEVPEFISEAERLNLDDLWNTLPKPEGFAKGGAVKDPDQMTHKPQPKTVNPLQSVARGWVAGTAGLPGDLESLARLAAKYLSAPGSLAERWGQGDTALPTTDFYREWLPGKQTGIGEEAEGLGSLLGGFGSTKLAAPIEKVGRAAIRNAAVPATLNKQAGVMKMSGGQWLKGEPEKAVRGLKKSTDDAQTALFASLPKEEKLRRINQSRQASGIDELPSSSYDTWLAKNFHGIDHAGSFALTPQEMSSLPGEALNKFVDKQLTTYIRNDMSTPGDPIRALAEKWAVDQPQQLAAAQAKLDALNAKGRQIAAERGVPEEYLTRHRQDVIAAEKEKQLIELTQGLHVNPEQLNFRPEMHGRFMETGQTAVAQSPAAKAWEGASDLKVYNNQAGDFLTDSGEWMPESAVRDVEHNPWLKKVPPETPVHSLSEASRLPNDLGFDHLMDELRNAVNPDSGLPPELLLKYENLPKITVPQAVERVAKINAWRAAKEVEANLAKANNAATHLHKEYPEGYKWVELKAPKDAPVVEGEYKDPMFDIPPAQQQRIQDEASLWAERQGLDPEDDAFMEAAINRAQELSAQYAKANKPKISQELQDALRYEGDTMKHCVGGYCPDVMEGKSRIFSLRDSKGQPHVTIETRPPELPPGYTNIEDAIADGYNVDNGHSIVQIKGPSNKAPKDEYLPYVQDFVKSGQWEDVGDFKHTGLVNKDSAIPWPSHFGIEDVDRVKGDLGGYSLQKFLDETGASYAAPEDFHQWLGTKGYSKGGIVQPSYNRPKLVNPRAKQNPTHEACKCQ